MIGSTAARPADKAWLALAGLIVTWEIMSPEGELLSEAVDRYRHHHPFVTNAAILVVSLHLLRAIPSRWDPLHRLAVVRR